MKIVFKFNSDDLYIEKIKIHDIALEYGTPIYIYSKQKIIKNFENYKNAFGLRDDIVCFACKTNSSFRILKLLSSLNSGADTTSGGEIYRCLNAGINPSKIVYAGVGKTSDEIIYALKNKILMFNVESFEELDLIDKISMKMNLKAKIAFRINPDVDPKTHSHIVTGKAGTKFGIPYNEALKAYLIAKKKKNIEIFGIHFHIGSQILDIVPFENAAYKIKKIVDDLSVNGINIKYINCGGGLGIKYKKNQNELDPKILVHKMFSIFGENKKFIFEPGRSIVGNAGVLLTKIIYRKTYSNIKNFFIVDSGMNDLIRPSLYNAYHEIIPIKKTNSKKIKVDVVGPICETGDFFAKDVMLPFLENGDYLLITCTGAYGMSMSSQYNSRLFLPEILIDNDNFLLIRKRSKYSDLLINEL
jgi:diaminopimelate decarboxylase